MAQSQNKQSSQKLNDFLHNREGSVGGGGSSPSSHFKQSVANSVANAVNSTPKQNPFNNINLEEANFEELFAHNPDWFSFETRIRKMVTQMIEPCVKRSIYDKETIQEMKKQNDIVKRKVDEVEFIVHKAQKKTATQEDFNKKIENNETRLKMTELKIKESIDKLFYMNQIQEEKVEMVDQERSAFLQRIENLGYELRRYKTELTKVKEDLHEELEKSHLELRQQVADFNLKVERLSSDMAMDRQAVEKQREQFKIFNHTMEVNGKRMEEIEGQLVSIEQKKVDKQINQQRMQVLEKDVKLCSNTMLTLERQLQETDQYVQLYLPLQGLNQIDGTLTYVFGTNTSLQLKLVKYHRLKFKELEDKIKGATSGALTAINKPLDNNYTNVTQTVQQQYQPFNKKYYYMPNWEQREIELQAKVNQTRHSEQSRSGSNYRHRVSGKEQHMNSLNLPGASSQHTKNHQGYHLRSDDLASSANMNSKQSISDLSQTTGNKRRTRQNSHNMPRYIVMKDGQSLEKSLTNVSRGGNEDSYRRANSRRLNPQQQPPYNNSTQQLSQLQGALGGVSNLQNGNNTPANGGGSSFVNSITLPINRKVLKTRAVSEDQQQSNKHVSNMSSELNEHQVNLKSQIADKSSSKVNNEDHHSSLTQQQQNDQHSPKMGMSQAHASVGGGGHSIHEIMELSEESDSITRSISKQLKSSGKFLASNLNNSQLLGNKNKLSKENLRILELNGGLSSHINLYGILNTQSLVPSNLMKEVNLVGLSGIALNTHNLDFSKDIADKSMRSDPNKSLSLQLANEQSSVSQDDRAVLDIQTDEFYKETKTYVPQSYKDTHNNDAGTNMGPPTHDELDYSTFDLANTNNNQTGYDAYRNNINSSNNENNKEQRRNFKQDDGELEDDDDDEGSSDYGDEYDDDPIGRGRHRSQNRIEMTDSMYDRLQRKFISEDDLDEYLRKMITNMMKDIRDIKIHIERKEDVLQLRLVTSQLKEDIEQINYGRQLESKSLQKQLDAMVSSQQKLKDQLADEMLICERKRRRDQVDASQQVKELETNLSKIQSDLAKIGSNDNQYKEVCTSLIDIIEIDNYLQGADEVDRKAISLMGVKDDNNGPMTSPQKQASQQNSNQNQTNQANQNNVLQIDKTCLTCSSQPYKIISAFKMACLTYFPSPVKIEDKIWTRGQLIQSKQHLLDQCKNRLEGKVVNANNMTVVGQGQYLGVSASLGDSYSQRVNNKFKSLNNTVVGISENDKDKFNSSLLYNTQLNRTRLVESIKKKTQMLNDDPNLPNTSSFTVEPFSPSLKNSAAQLKSVKKHYQKRDDNSTSFSQTTFLKLRPTHSTNEELLSGGVTGGPLPMVIGSQHEISSTYQHQIPMPTIILDKQKSRGVSNFSLTQPNSPQNNNKIQLKAHQNNTNTTNNSISRQPSREDSRTGGGGASNKSSSKLQRQLRNYRRPSNDQAAVSTPADSVVGGGSNQTFASTMARPLTSAIDNAQNLPALEKNRDGSKTSKSRKKSNHSKKDQNKKVLQTSND